MSHLEVSGEKGEVGTQGQSDLVPQVEDFKYHGYLKVREEGSSRLIDVCSVCSPSLLCVPTLSYDLELWGG